MTPPTRQKFDDSLDGLRLLGLSRIPRCGDCPRFRALVRSHEHRRAALETLPAAPAYCTHQVCAPMASRYGAECDGKVAALLGRAS